MAYRAAADVRSAPKRCKVDSQAVSGRLDVSGATRACDDAAGITTGAADSRFAVGLRISRTSGTHTRHTTTSAIVASA